jgi:hypothetical protein
MRTLKAIVSMVLICGFFQVTNASAINTKPPKPKCEGNGSSTCENKVFGADCTYGTGEDGICAPNTDYECKCLPLDMNSSCVNEDTSGCTRPGRRCKTAEGKKDGVCLITDHPDGRGPVCECDADALVTPSLAEIVDAFTH